MRGGFQGFSTKALEFFRELEANNEREWFEERKSVYVDEIKKPMEALVTEVGSEMLKYAREAVTTPGKAIYRIYRDTRFSNDKTPYKTHIGASFFRSDLGKHVSAHYYFEVSHKHVGLAGGIYMPDAEHLRAVRLHMMENHERLEKLLKEKKLAAAMGDLQGERLSRPPKGFPADHPALERLKLKQMYFWRELAAETACEQGLVKEISTRFRLMTPVMEFLNEPLLADKKRRAPLETGWI